MLTNNEVYEAFCRDRCKYMNPPTVDALDACANCPISRLTSPPPWYAYPDFIPPDNSICLLTDIQRSKFMYTVGVYKEQLGKKSGFYSPILLETSAQLFPTGFQVIHPPTYFLQNKKKNVKIGGLL